MQLSGTSEQGDWGGGCSQGMACVHCHASHCHWGAAWGGLLTLLTGHFLLGGELLAA